MSNPTRGDWDRFKRLARYLKGRPRVVKKFDRQRPTSTMSIYTEADSAGDKKTSKSASGGCIMMGEHLLKGLVEAQTFMALSRGEFEFYATLRAEPEAIDCSP